MSLVKYKIQIGKGKLIGLILVAIFVAYFAYNSDAIKNNPDYKYSHTQTAPKEYWDLFSDTVKKKMGVVETSFGRSQCPVTVFNYDNKRYFINIVKIDLVNTESLNKSITVSSLNNLQINSATYQDLGGIGLDIFYRTRKHSASHINLNLFGKPINTIASNDSIVCLYSDFKIFSIKYDRSDTSAIWAMSEGKPPTIPESTLPIDVMFIKKQSGIYLLTMSTNDNNIKLDPDKLYSIIYHKLR